MKATLNSPGNPGANDSIPRMPTVLLVDDDPVIRHLVASVLKRNHIECVVARNGREGLEAARNNPVNLVLLDVKLPDIGGFEVLTRIKSADGTSDIPVIMLSGSDREDHVSTGFKLGAEDYMLKPPREGDLLARILAVHVRERMHRIARGFFAAGTEVEFPVEHLNHFLRRQGSIFLPKGIRSPRLTLGDGTASLFAYIDFPALRARRPVGAGSLALAKELMRERPVWIDFLLITESGLAQVQFRSAEIGGREMTDSELEKLSTEYIVPCLLPPMVGQSFGLWPGVERLQIRHSGVVVTVGEPPEGSYPDSPKAPDGELAEDGLNDLKPPRTYWS